MNQVSLWRNLTLVGLAGLVALIVLWNLVLAKVQYVPVWLELLLLLAPLLALVPGVMKGNPKTHVYAILISLLYLLLGIWIAIDPVERVYGYGLIVLSVCLYAGAFMTAKILGKKA